MNRMIGSTRPRHFALILFALCLSLALTLVADGVRPASGSGLPSVSASLELRASSPLRISPTNPTANEPVTATFRVRNTGDQRIYIDESMAAVRVGNDWTGAEEDFPHAWGTYLAPGQEYIYTRERTFPPGTYQAETRVKVDDFWYEVPGGNHISFTVKSNQPGHLEMVTPLSVTPSPPFIGDTVTAAFKLRNGGDRPLSVQELTASVRLDRSGLKPDFPSTEPFTLQPGQEYSYSRSQTLSTGGNYRVRPMARIGDVWYAVDGAQEATFALSDPLQVTGFTLSKTNLWAGDSVDACVKMVSRARAPFPIQELNVQLGLRTSAGREDLSIPFAKELTLQPGQEYSECKPRVFPDPGYGTAQLVVKTESGPLANLQGASNIDVTVKDTLLGVGGIDLSVANPAAGQDTEASFTVKNVGPGPVLLQDMVVAARQSKNMTGRNVDYPPASDVTLQPGEQYTYRQSRSFTPEGDYYGEVRVRVGDSWRPVEGLKPVSFAVGPGQGAPNADGQPDPSAVLGAEPEIVPEADPAATQDPVPADETGSPPPNGSMDSTAPPADETTDPTSTPTDTESESPPPAEE